MTSEYVPFREKKDGSDEAADTFDYDSCSACSAMDCTGLIPAAPISEDEIESYKELYNFEPPKVTVVSKEDTYPRI